MKLKILLKAKAAFIYFLCIFNAHISPVPRLINNLCNALILWIPENKSVILSIVGMLYGAGGAVGVDLDPMALSAARENAEKNGIPEEKFILIRGNLLEEQDLVQRLLSLGEKLYGDKQFSGFPLICGNLLAEVLIAMAPCFPKLLCHNGLFLGSGILKEKAQAVEKAFLDAGLIQCRTRFLGDWAMVSAKKPWPER